MPLQEHEIPTVVVLNGKDYDRTKGISTSAIYNNTASGVEEIFTDFSKYDVNYSDTIDTIIEFLTESVEISYDDTEIEIIRNGLSALDINTLVTMLIALKNLNLTDAEVELYFAGYFQKVINDTIVSYRVNLGKVPTIRDTEVDMYIWGVKTFKCLADIFCTTMTSGILNVDIEQALGRITKLDSDIFATRLKEEGLDTDIYSAVMSTATLDSELTTISGRISKTDVDIFSTKLGLTEGHPVDFKLRSLFTSDFFIEQDKFTTASSIAWVDVIDYLYPINTDNTYLTVDGTMASGIWFEDIPNGKRLYYDPLDDFYSDGVLTYSLHAESSIGEVEEKDFYLLYGYNLEPNEVVDWGPNKNVIVRVEAQNLVFCPNTEGEAFNFKTSDLKSINLKCTIRPVGYVDLPIKISPQSTVFYYGKTYTVKVKNVKDFAGNIMPDFEYTFTIEDPNA